MLGFVQVIRLIRINHSLVYTNSVNDCKFVILHGKLEQYALHVVIKVIVCIFAYQN